MLSNELRQQLDARLQRARTQLIIDKPFFGALILRLPIVHANPEWCPTTATDSLKLYINPEYIHTINDAELKFMMAHEAMHCALSHFTRRLNRNKLRWDVACDYAINPILKDEGFESQPNTLYDHSFKGMAAEEIYPYIKQNTKEEPMDGHAWDDCQQQKSSRPQNQGQQETKQPDFETEQAKLEHGAPPPTGLGSGQQQDQQTRWQQRLAGAAQQAMQAGKMGASLARMLEHLLQPQLPWRNMLAQYMTALARDDYSYMRSSRRSDEIIMPSLRSAQVNMVIALDTSGSIKNQELQSFVSEVNALKGQVRARVTLLYCDAELAHIGPLLYEPWEAMEADNNIKGGGGTNYQPVFNWVSQQDIAPDLLIYFTDAGASFPKNKPNYPVLWLIKGKKKVAWGQRIQLN